MQCVMLLIRAFARRGPFALPLRRRDLMMRDMVKRDVVKRDMVKRDMVKRGWCFAY